jgi:hypothetical protein
MPIVLANIATIMSAEALGLACAILFSTIVTFYTMKVTLSDLRDFASKTQNNSGIPKSKQHARIDGRCMVLESLAYMVF